MHSAIYEGRIRHRRCLPVRHAFAYRLFMLYLDLDELPGLFRGHPLFSVEGRRLARFRRADHLKHSSAAQDLRASVRDLVEAKTGARPAGPIRLLTHLEYFRYRFNPVSFYYCFDAAAARVEAVVAEINNTPWGEQHCYVLPNPEPDGQLARREFHFPKTFHVSPFMDMDLDYRWRFSMPGERLFVYMENRNKEVRQFQAVLRLKRRPLTPAALTWLLVKYPLMTVQIIAAIYWEALRLRLKFCPHYPNPASGAKSKKGAHSC